MPKHSRRSWLRGLLLPAAAVAAEPDPQAQPALTASNVVLRAGVAARPSSNQFVLSGPPLGQGEVVVTLNRQTLQEGVDFYVDVNNLVVVAGPSLGPDDRISFMTVRPATTGPAGATSLFDIATAGQGINFSTGPDGKIIIAVDPELMERRSFVSFLYPDPIRDVMIFGEYHGVKGQALLVMCFDNQAQRQPIEMDSYSVDPDTFDVRIQFAEDQANFYIAILGGR